MSQGLLLATLLMIVSGCVSAPTTVLSPKIISIKNDFRDFASEPSPSEDSQFFQKNKRIYEGLVYKELVGNSEAIMERKQRLIGFLKDDGSRAREILKAFEQLELTAHDHIGKFRSIFPNGDYDYQIYFLPSLLWFSGRADVLSDDTVVVAFGVDNIVKNNEGVPVLFAHEMFHALHFKTLKLRSAELKSMESDLIAQLWFEGFASFQSAVINKLEPRPSQVFGKLGQNFETNRQSIIKAYLKDIELSPRFTPEMMDKWFGSGDDKLGIPPMAGYCIGLLVLEQLSKSYDARDLLVWNPKAKTAEIRKAVSSLIR